VSIIIIEIDIAVDIEVDSRNLEKIWGRNLCPEGFEGSWSERLGKIVKKEPRPVGLEEDSLVL
jgi:hypothetical protein